MIVTEKKPVPIYEVTCCECKSKIQYKKSEVFTCHIQCPVCGVSLWVDTILPVRYEGGRVMKDYVEREAAIMAVTRAKLPDVTPDGVPIANGKRSVTDCVRRIKNIPAADVRPVVRGEWISTYDGKTISRMEHGEPLDSCKCSVCGEWLVASDEYAVKGNFCPNCGARMDGGDDK